MEGEALFGGDMKRSPISTTIIKGESDLLPAKKKEKSGCPYR